MKGRALDERLNSRHGTKLPVGLAWNIAGPLRGKAAITSENRTTAWLLVLICIHPGTARADKQPNELLV